MDIIEGLVEALLFPIVLAAIPILFILIFDIAAHLGDLFGDR